MMYVELMKNFLLFDSSELLAVRLISASWAQKRLILTFLEGKNQTFLGSGGWNESNSPQLDRIEEKKIFMNSTYIMSRK